MDTTAKIPVMLYTEQTPNPESLKYVTNRILYRGMADFREAELANEWSPLASALFELPYVKGVYISSGFVTITKEFNYAWEDIMLKLKQFIKEYIESGETIVNEGFAEAMEKIEEARQESHDYSEEESEIVERIKAIIDERIKPAVQGDGGNIVFKSFNEGIVTLILQGACSGCPSSTITLKNGIEHLLKHMIPQVKEVVSEMG